jgi:hypothetical protein
MTYRIPLRIVFYREQDAWIAHCLELDLLGDGASQSDALVTLRSAIETQLAWSLENGDPSLLFSPAPREFEVMFAAGEDIAQGEIRLDAAPQSPSPDYIFESARLRRYSGPVMTPPFTAAS